MDWIFNGIGTSILGFILGGAIGYRIGIKQKIKINQKQKAGDNSNQTQIGINK